MNEVEFMARCVSGTGDYALIIRCLDHLIVQMFERFEDAEYAKDAIDDLGCQAGLDCIGKHTVVRVAVGLAAAA